jgi:hypothetical protein
VSLAGHSRLLSGGKPQGAAAAHLRNLAVGARRKVNSRHLLPRLPLPSCCCCASWLLLLLLLLQAWRLACLLRRFLRWGGTIIRLCTAAAVVTATVLHSCTTVVLPCRSRNTFSRR